MKGVQRKILVARDQLHLFSIHVQCGTSKITNFFRGTLILIAVASIVLGTANGNYRVREEKSFSLSEIEGAGGPVGEEYTWRGYLFKVNTNMSLIGLRGGSQYIPFYAAVFEVDSENKLSTIVASSKTPTEIAQRMELSAAPILTPNQKYFIGQGQQSDRGGVHYSLAWHDLPAESAVLHSEPILASWEHSLNLGTTGSPSSLKGKSVGKPGWVNHNPDMGLIYVPLYPTPTPTASGSLTPSPTPTTTGSLTHSPTPTMSGSLTPSPTPTTSSSPTPSPTPTRSGSPTPSPFRTPSMTSSASPTQSGTRTSSSSPTPTASHRSSTPSSSWSASLTPSSSCSRSATSFVSPSSSTSSSPTSSASTTTTSTVSETSTGSISMTPRTTPSKSNPHTETATISGTSSLTPSSSVTSSPSSSASMTSTLSVSETSTMSGTETPSASVTASISASVSRTPADTPSASISASTSPAVLPTEASSAFVFATVAQVALAASFGTACILIFGFILYRRRRNTHLASAADDPKQLYAAQLGISIANVKVVSQNNETNKSFQIHEVDKTISGAAAELSNVAKDKESRVHAPDSPGEIEVATVNPFGSTSGRLQAAENVSTVDDQQRASNKFSPAKWKAHRRDIRAIGDPQPNVIEGSTATEHFADSNTEKLDSEGISSYSVHTSEAAQSSQVNQRDRNCEVELANINPLTANGSPLQAQYAESSPSNRITDKFSLRKTRVQQRNIRHAEQPSEGIASVQAPTETTEVLKRRLLIKYESFPVLLLTYGRVEKGNSEGAPTIKLASMGNLDTSNMKHLEFAKLKLRQLKSKLLAEPPPLVEVEFKSLELNGASSNESATGTGSQSAVSQLEFAKKDVQNTRNFLSEEAKQQYRRKAGISHAAKKEFAPSLPQISPNRSASPSSVYRNVGIQSHRSRGRLNSRS